MDRIAKISPGDKVRHANRLWEVIKIEGEGDYAKVTLFNASDGTKTGYKNDLVLEIIRSPIDLLRSKHFCSPKAFSVFTKAAKLALAYEYDRFLSIPTSRTRLEPFQLAAVLKAITSLRTRLLLADDVGLGKSIEAGLIFKELEARGRANRVLLVVPASLINQWKREMYEKFGVEFYEADRNFINALSAYSSDEETPWQKFPLLITSIDFMKQFTQNEQKIKAYDLLISRIEARKKKTNKSEIELNDLQQILTEIPNIAELINSKFLEKLQKGKIPKHFQGLGDTKWDLIIIDEAHYCDKTTGSRGEAKGNARSRLADALAERCDSLLLLTATPHNGDPMSLYSLIELLEPYLFRDVQDMRENPEKIHQVMVRRGKKGLIDVSGNKIFKEREVHTLQVEGWSSAEKEFYDKISHYLKGGFLSADSAKGQKRRNLNFAMVILQKRAASGIAAIKISLERRIEKLSKRSYALSKAENREIDEYTRNEIDLTDEKKEQVEQKLESIPIHESIEAIDAEIADLKMLHKLASRIETDAKWETLRRYLRRLFAESPEEKVIIFTEYRDTLNDLIAKLKKDMPWISQTEAKAAKRAKVIKGFAELGTAIEQTQKTQLHIEVSVPFEEAVTIIHGNMTQEQRVKSEEQFMRDSCRILLATDSASEGLNLQKKCHILINYELPWNPNRLEQRIGRVHRYGQKKDVNVFNLLNLDTREGKILERLQEKIDEISKAIGNVGEVLGIVAKANIEEAIRRSLKDDIPPELTAREIEEAIEENRKICEEYQRMGLTKLQEFDSTEMRQILGLLEKNKELEENWQNGKLFQQLMSIFFKDGAVTPKKNPGEFKVKIPVELHSEISQRTIESVVFEKNHPLLDNGYHTELLGLGHPVLKALLKRILSDDMNGKGSSTYMILSDAQEVGLLINFRYKIESESLMLSGGIGESKSRMEVLAEEIIPIFVSDNCCSFEDGKKFSGCKALRLPFPNELASSYEHKIDHWCAKAEAVIREKILEKKQRIAAERHERIDLRLEDLQRYYQGMHELHSQRLRKYENEKAMGLERTALINREKFELENLASRVNQQKKMLEAMRNVYDYAPEVLNAAWIIPEKLTRRVQDAAA